MPKPPVSLKSLGAQLVRDADGGTTIRHDLPDPKTAQGVMLDCPCGEGHSLVVWFSTALDGSTPAHPSCTPTYRWKATGSSLADLTLHPSVNAGCWHGYIVKGQASTC